MKNHFRERKVVLMDINNVSKAPEAAKAAEATNHKHVTKVDGEIRAKTPELRKNYDAISKDGDTLEISEKQIAKNQAGKVTISEDSIKSQPGTYTAATLAKMSKVRLKQLLTDGKITRQQYDKAAKSS